jgi:hypothetical protein
MAKPKIPSTSQAKKGAPNLAALGQMTQDSKKKVPKTNPYFKPKAM